MSQLTVLSRKEAGVADASARSRTASPVHVSRPGDSYEVEADRAAAHVSGSGSVAGWSFSSLSRPGIQREEESKPTAASIAAKVAEAAAGLPQVKGPLEKTLGSTLGLSLLGGTVLAGGTGLALAGKELPFQVPEIPLDKVRPGLSLGLDLHGPVNHPTSGGLTLKLKAPEGEHKPDGKLPLGLRQRIAAQELFHTSTPLAGPGSGAAAKAQFDTQMMLLQAQALQRQLESRMAAARFQTATSARANEARPSSPGVPDPFTHEEGPVQRKEAPGAPLQTGLRAVDAVTATHGRPLDHSTRRLMERRFGYSFRDVRIHTDWRAAQSARAVGALAYTAGNRIVFGAGLYAPQSTAGQRLLAHELTHVVQQGGPARRQTARM